MRIISDHHIASEGGSAARIVFPNDCIPIEQCAESQAVDCPRCVGRGEDAHGSICTGCFGTGKIFPQTPQIQEGREIPRHDFLRTQPQT